MQERLLTVKEAATAAVTCRSTVYGWVGGRCFPVYRRGGKGKRGKILIPEGPFLAFLETQRVEPGPTDAAPLRFKTLKL